MRAWWSSRSSKPLPRHDVSGGRFDSYPLRQFFIKRNHLRKEVIAMSREQILKLTALSSCAG